MKFILKLVWLFISIALILLLIYKVSGQSFETLFNQQKCVEWFSDIKTYAWFAGILLLISDILLPVPATGVMAASGIVYGMGIGWVINFTGSVLAGLIGYTAARFLGKKAGRWIASDNEIERFTSFFDRWGPYAIIVSRIMPVMPEVMTILAGFSRMKFSRFLAALVAGTVPVSFLFTWIGVHSGSEPGMGIILSVLIPLFMWPFFLKLSKL